ncbi:MFS transporter [Nocardia barduliensis]|uniref:MFS transporter n=1 Tax=Nocardia barduliensis TaxID=2736643 RepID=UPI0028AAF2DF|nr:MFS transporter [Nocardia barduliensis]
MTTERKATSWTEFRDYLGVVIVLAGGVLVGAINIYLVGSLLPSAVADIGGERLYAWSTTVFSVAQVAGTLAVSRMLSLRGTVGSYLIGFGVFATGSGVCALSPVMAVFLMGRGVQGLGAGLLTGLGFAAVYVALPQSLWVRGTALISAMFGVGTIVGPAMGGLFAQFGVWRAAFVVLAVAGVAAASFAPRVLPKSDDRHAPAPVPVVSLVLVVGAATAVSVAGVVSGAAAMTLALAVAIASVAVFLTWERRARQRILPLATYRSGSSLRWVYLTIVVLSAGVGVEMFLPLFAQRLASLPPVVAGFFGAALSLGWPVSQMLVAPVQREATIRRLRVAGPLLLAIGFLGVASLQRDHVALPMVLAWLPLLFLAGAGIGIAWPHLSVAAMTSAPDPEEGQKAAAAIATILTMSTAFGAAVAGLLVNLGGSELVDSARYLLVGFTAIAALGVLTALRVNHTTHIPEDTTAL